MEPIKLYIRRRVECRSVVPDSDIVLFPSISNLGYGRVSVLWHLGKMQV